MNKNIYVSIAETIEDCQAIIKWAKKKNISKLKVIALSLESFRYLKRIERIGCIHVWNIIDMENILHQSFLDSQRATGEWISLFSNREDNFYDVAVQYELDVNSFYHALVSIRVAEQLKAIFAKNNWTYLVPPIKLILQSEYLPFSQQRSRRNLLFKSISATLFVRQGIKVKYISLFNQFKVLFLPFAFTLSILNKILYDIAETLRGFLLHLKTMDKMLNIGPKHFDVVISGWGSNLSRMLSINKFKESIEKKNQISCLNLIWRPQKIKEFDIEKSSGPKFHNIIVREEIRKDVAYGPKLSMFPVSFWPRYLSKLFLNILLPRYKKIFNKSETRDSKLLKEILKYNAIKIDTAFTVFFSYRAIFLTRELVKKIFRRFSSFIFVGSDSGAANTRGELLTAKQFGLTALSTPHGYQSYSMPPYNYLADKVLTHGEASRELLIKTGVFPGRIIYIGNNHPRQDQLKRLSDKIRVVIATRSRGGLWSNYSSCQNLYDKQIWGLVSLLVREGQFNVVIKSHPNGDYYKYYDLIVEDINSDNISHISRGWKLDKFAESCDITVCLGECPSFFLSALFLNIPLIFIENTMSKTLKSLHYDYKDACAVVDSFGGAFQEIKKIAFDKQYRKNLLSKQQKFIQGYTKDHPEENLVKVIEGLLNKN